MHLAHSKSPPSKITLKPLSCFDITMQRGCNILISYMVLDSENAISRASFVSSSLISFGKTSNEPCVLFR